jgi:hypothetical protein
MNRLRVCPDFLYKELVNDMNMKYLIPAVLVSLLSGCASMNDTSDPVRARVLAELQQARADGSLPLTEAAYMYPQWDKTPAVDTRTAQASH